MQINLWFKNFFKWLHYNRIMIVIVLFIIVLPITLTLSIYLGSYLSNRSVHFDPEVTDETENIRRFDAIDDIEHFELMIDWDSFKRPVSNDQGVLTGGYYTFKANYQPAEGFQVTNVMATPVLRTPWMQIRSLGQPVLLTNQDRILYIDFNHELPVSPLWFVKVTDPILYLKITYTRILANQSEVEETVYIRYPLKDIDPNQVIRTDS
ncbi:MAG: hypothetical protein ACNA7K_00500 [Acholeplasmataceae bacterium]